MGFPGSRFFYCLIYGAFEVTNGRGYFLGTYFLRFYGYFFYVEFRGVEGGGVAFVFSVCDRVGCYARVVAFLVKGSGAFRWFHVSYYCECAVRFYDRAIATSFLGVYSSISIG